jgi:hypothetical protein
MVMSALLLAAGQAGRGERAPQAAGVGLVGLRRGAALADGDAIRRQRGEGGGLLVGAGVERLAPRVTDAGRDAAIADGSVDELIALGTQLGGPGLRAGAGAGVELGDTLADLRLGRRARQTEDGPQAGRDRLRRLDLGGLDLGLGLLDGRLGLVGRVGLRAPAAASWMSVSLASSDRPRLSARARRCSSVMSDVASSSGVEAAVAVVGSGLAGRSSAAAATRWRRR